jgi:nucleoside-diphosphate-sugar epimerase
VLEGKKILLTGGTGQVASPVAESLARGNDVWCVGRFTDPLARSSLETLGISTFRWDMACDILDGLPRDFSHVFHAAVLRDTDDYDAAIEVNCVGAARLMEHCRTADSFLFVSTTGVYRKGEPDRLYTEHDPLGGSHETPLAAYHVAKVSAEGTVRALARTLELPTTIARLNVCYGPQGHGGVPIRFLREMMAGRTIAVPRNHQNWCTPIHTDDIVRQTPLLWEIASTPACIVNWGGDDAVTDQEMMRYVSDLTGVEVHFEPSDMTREMVAADPTRRRALIGDCEVEWHEGVRRTLQAHFPAILEPTSESTSRRQ